VSRHYRGVSRLRQSCGALRSGVGKTDDLARDEISGMEVDFAAVPVLFGVESHWASAYSYGVTVLIRFSYGETSPPLVEDG
jgi:hypothetical protein